MASGGAEVGLVYPTESTASTFRRFSLEGSSWTFSGGIGPWGGSYSYGKAAPGDLFSETTSVTITSGSGFSKGYLGAMFSHTNTRLIKQEKTTPN